MDLSEIETFLTIVNTKSITKTADILFLSQPTVSHRLKSLEKELGFPLIVRKKGFKNVELTSKAVHIPVEGNPGTGPGQGQHPAVHRMHGQPEYRPFCRLLPADGDIGLPH